MNDNGTNLAVMEAPQQAIQARGVKRSEVIRMGDRGVQPETMADLWLMAERIAVSGLAPKGMERPETIFVALEMGMELGLPLMSSLRNIAVINGRPSIWGDAALALVQSTGLLEDYDEHVDGEGDELVGVVVSKRKGRSKPIKTTFSVADAKKAGLWGKQGPWSQYAPRMLKLRARGFNLRDNFPDVLQGLYTVEEAGDIPAVAPVTQISAVPNPTNKLNRMLAEKAPPQVIESTGEIIESDSLADSPSPASHPTTTDATETEAPQSAAGESAPAEKPAVDPAVFLDAAKFENLLVGYCIENGIAEDVLNKRLTEWCKKLGGGRIVKMEKLMPGQRKELYGKFVDGTFFA